MIRFFNKQKQFEQDVMEQGMQYSSGFYGDSLRRLKKNKMAMFCAGILVLLVLVAIFAPVIAPYDPTYQDYSAVLILKAKALLMERNTMTEPEAYRYIQKCSMDNGTSLTETAQMIISLIHM